jgi:uncharacterized protein YbjT (DUF2867 family)
MRLLKTILLTVVGLIAVLAVVVIITLRPNIPASTVDLTPPAAVGNLNVLVFGGTRNTGLEVIKLLTVRGDKVTAFVRPTSNRSALEPLGVDFAVGDAMDPESLDRAFEASQFDAVLTTIGNLRANPPPDYQGNANIFDAAKRAGVNRMIMVSTIGAGDSESATPWLSKLALAKILPLKSQAEEHLRASGLDYTIVRPGGLPPGPGSGRGLLSEDPSTFGFIARPDLARLIVGILDDDKTIGKTYSAIDPERSSPWDSDS